MTTTTRTTSINRSPFDSWVENEINRTLVTELLEGLEAKDGFGPGTEFPNSFLVSIARQAKGKRILSHAQVMTARAALETRKRGNQLADERNARFKGVRKAKVKTGSQVIEGEVIGTPRRGSSIHLMIETGKHRIYGYCPSALRYVPTDDGKDVREIAPGDVVKFRAAITAHKQDPYFGFFKTVSEIEYRGRADMTDAG